MKTAAVPSTPTTSAAIGNMQIQALALLLGACLMKATVCPEWSLLFALGSQSTCSQRVGLVPSARRVDDGPSVELHDLAVTKGSDDERGVFAASALDLVKAASRDALDACPEANVGGQGGSQGFEVPRAKLACGGHTVRIGGSPAPLLEHASGRCIDVHFPR